MSAATARQAPMLLLLLACLFGAGTGVAADAPDGVRLDQVQAGLVGQQATWLAEAGRRLTLGEAVAAWRSGAFRPTGEAALTYGIGHAPVWIHLRVYNPMDHPLARRLSIETSWLDRIALHIRHAGRTVDVARMGDRFKFARRPVHGRGFAVDHAFAPGPSDIFIRVQTPDPMVVPLRIHTAEQAAARGKWLDYSYGFLYGFLLALIAYNALLFAGLGERRYLLYSLYLCAFLMANLSYTGHGFAWLWPASPTWAQWSQPSLILLYAFAGLVFALDFLQIRRYFPRVHHAVLGAIGLAAGLLLLFFAAGAQVAALLLTFVFVSLFSVAMVLLGIMSQRAGMRAARYFLAGSLCAMFGTAATAFSVWGLIPYSEWTYRAAEVGMQLDATLLALALTYRFRVVRAEWAQAREQARLDPLTGINNRRAFHDVCAPIWSITARNDRDLALILIDIDRFKRINDTFGHVTGDAVLLALVRTLGGTVREQDLLARWGGEEFVVLLPETDIDQAMALAERLREVVAASRSVCEGHEMSLTVSLGVAARRPGDAGIDDVLDRADRCLYRAKQTGRNRVVGPADGEPGPDEVASTA